MTKLVTIMRQEIFEWDLFQFYNSRSINSTWYPTRHSTLSQKNRQMDVFFLTKKIARLHVHVERAIGRVKDYKILKDTLPATMQILLVYYNLLNKTCLV